MDSSLDHAAAIQSFVEATRDAPGPHEVTSVEQWLVVLWNIYFAQEDRNDPAIFVSGCAIVVATLRGRPHAGIKHELHYIVDGTDHVTRGMCGLYFAPGDRIISVNLAAGDHFLRDEGFRRGATAKEFDHGWDVHPGEPEEYHFEHSWMMSEMC